MRSESGMVSAEREEGWMDLRFRKVIERFCLTCGVGMRMSMVIARWSEVPDGDAGGADNVQCVSFFMGWKIHTLGEVEDIEDVQQFCRGFGVG